MCEVQIRAGVGCETGFLKPAVECIQLISQMLILIFFRPGQSDAGSLEENWFLSFSEWLLLAALISFVSLFVAWLYKTLSPLL